MYQHNVNPSSTEVFKLQVKGGVRVKTSSLCLPPRPTLKVTFQFFYRVSDII